MIRLMKMLMARPGTGGEHYPKPTNGVVVTEVHNQGVNPDRAVRRVVCLVATVVVLMMGACMSTPPPATSGAAEPSSAPGGGLTVAVQPETEARLEVADGLRVTLPVGGVSAPGRLTVTPMPADQVSKETRVARGWSVELEQTTLTGTATLAFSVPQAQDPLVGFVDAQGKLQPVTGRREGDRYVVPTNHFSSWLSTSWDQVLQTARAGLDRLYAGGSDNKQPQCDRENEVKAAGVTVTSSGGSRVMWCLGKADGRMLLNVTNARGYAVTMEYTSGLTLVENPDVLAWMPSLSSLLDRPSKKGNKLTLVAAGETVQFTLASSPQNQGVMAQPSVPAFLASGLWYAADTVSTVSGWFGGDTSKIIAAVDVVTCAKAAVNKRSVTIENAGEMATYLSEMLGLSFGCFDKALAQEMAGSIISGPVIAGFSWLWSGILTALNGFGAAADTALNPEGYRITVDLGVGESTVPAVSQLIAAGVCDAGAIASGSVHFEHPTWGRSVLATCKTAEPPGVMGAAVFDRAGRLQWKRRIDDTFYEFRVNAPGADASGNLFVIYNPGRYDGLEIYRPTADGMRILAGWEAGEMKEPNFYYAEIAGPGQDGLFRVIQWNNDCTPDCAGGTITSKTYRWDGRAYVE